ncbi:hypothetical protein Glove_99g41 [Diversispora epigaea]|uniref:Uncharacterized protein n=1 Tax=Diversispora epigaea TaxID=1348612 RepID=A0A397JDS0_9GLOM|nr:hypothetical protein Glove_99g41 [Diversispora epigaea]
MEAFKFIFLLFLIVSLFNVNDAVSRATTTTISKIRPTPIYRIETPMAQKRSDKKLKRRFVCNYRNCPVYSLRKRAFCNCPRPIYEK